MVEVLICLVVSFFITYLTIPLILNLSKKYSELLKEPNTIASHKTAVATFGGVAIFFGVIFSFFLLLKVGDNEGLNWIIGSICLIFFLGVVDDLIKLSPLMKFLGQLLAILIIVYFNDLRITSMQGIFGIYQLPYTVSLIFTVLTMIVITNAYNLIDGIDSLATLIGLFIVAIFFISFYLNDNINMMVLISAIIGSLSAFLRYNWHPAKIFMGDSGSLLIGFLISIFAVKFIETTFNFGGFSIKTAPLSMALLVIPLLDLLRVFIVRVYQKKSPFSGDRNHLHHLILDSGVNQTKTAIILLGFNVIVFSIILFFNKFEINLVMFLLAVLCLLFLFILKKLK
ncbi:MAG: glycosyltransferase family 4 protein [Flavobacteriales bacterium]